MAVQIMDIGIKLRKVLIFMIKACYRLALNRPFIVGMLSFLIFLYRSSPFMFSLLLSASPILICTAILLGILLSYGESNLPEIEERIDERTTCENVLVKKSEEVPLDSSVVERNESFHVERYGNNEVGLTADLLTFSENKIDDEIRDEDFVDDTTPLIEERSRRIELNHDEEREGNGKVDDLRNKQKIESNEDVVSDMEITEHHHYAPIPNMDDEHLRLESDDDDDESETDSFDSEKVNVDSLDSPPHSPWSRVEEPEGELGQEDEDDVVDSESDGSESSSPDASMADIMPMLDELHPLLNEGASQTVPLPRIQESDNELEHEEDENEDEEDEEEEEDDDVKVDIEEETKSAITWTEEDQKNLMDLGSSEIERNLRLEHLIMRRRSRRDMATERNLIDLEGFDLPFTIPPITTRRQNPFDALEDSYDSSGLAPIPGSAPSVLLPRRNPFDLPYDSSEEKPDLKGDGFQEEFKPLQTRESLFRRYESFKVGPSSLAPERQDVRMRPYFVPERTFSEESNYSLFQRQSSGLSESKVSSVPETESLGSVDDLEERKISEEEEEDNFKEPEAAIPQIGEIGEESLLVEPQQLIISDAEDAREEDVITTHEPELISNMEVGYEIGHGSQSSSSSESESESEEEDHQEPCQVEQKDGLGRELETQLGNISSHYQEESIPHSVEFQSIPSKNVAQRYSRGSSSSSLSEVSERIYTEPEPEGFFVLEEVRDIVTHQDQDIVTQNSVESTTRLSISSNTSVPDILQREQPVYDLSPREVGTDLASSSISPDVHETIGVHQGNEFESVSTDTVNMGEHENATANLSEADLMFDNEGSLTALSGKNLMEQHELDQIPSTSVDINTHDLIEPSEYQTHTQLQDEEYVLISENDVHNHDREIHSEIRLITENLVEKDDISVSLNSDSDHLHEVQESKIASEPSDDVRTIHEQYMPEIQGLDSDINSLKEDSSLDLGSISIPSNESETTIAHVGMPKIVEEADEIRQIDEALLSELDFVGDFSNKGWVSGSNEFEKPVDSISESMSSTHHPDTSTMRLVEVNSIEENTEHIMGSEILNKDTDMKENDTKEAQNLDKSTSEHIDMKEDEILSEGNAVQDVVDSSVSHSYENISGILEVKAQADEIAKTMETDEPRSAVNEDICTNEQHEVEASTLEHIDLAFTQISDDEMMNPANFGMPESNLMIIESVTEQSESGETSHEASNLKHAVESSETSELRVLEYVSSESTPPELVMEVKPEDNMKLNVNDRPLEVQEVEVSFSAEDLSVKEINATAVEDLHSITSGNDDHIQNVEKHGEGETFLESNETDDAKESSELNMLVDKEVLEINEKLEHIVKEHEDIHLSSSLEGKAREL